MLRLKVRLGIKTLYLVYRDQLLKEAGFRVKNEYELIKTAWMQQQQRCNSDSFPTLEQYDNMMGAVTSRGFDGLGYDGVDVMIPLLDLLNHVRGHHGGLNVDDDDDHGRSNSSSVARVRYQRYSDDEREETPPSNKRIKTANTTHNCNSGGGGGVKVTTAQAISISNIDSTTIPLHMTYGAKSNSTLLGRYGFCIENNVEPDGE